MHVSMVCAVVPCVYANILIERYMIFGQKWTVRFSVIWDATCLWVQMFPICMNRIPNRVGRYVSEMWSWSLCSKCKQWIGFYFNCSGVDLNPADMIAKAALWATSFNLVFLFCIPWRKYLYYHILCDPFFVLLQCKWCSIACSFFFF